MSDEIAQTEVLLQLARRFHLSELEWQEEGLRILIRRDGTLLEVPEVVPVPAAAPIISPEVVTPTNLLDLCAPMTGVFYRAPSPDAPPYVEVGDYVEEGQIICLIEAMKVFNEIPADRSGRVVQICAESGQLVEQGAVLFRLEPKEEVA